MKKWQVQKTALAAGLTAAFHICPPLQACCQSSVCLYGERVGCNP